MLPPVMMRELFQAAEAAKRTPCTWVEFEHAHHMDAHVVAQAVRPAHSHHASYKCRCLSVLPCSAHQVQGTNGNCHAGLLQACKLIGQLRSSIGHQAVCRQLKFVCRSTGQHCCSSCASTS